MQKNLENALLLDDNNFIDTIISFNQKEVLITLEQHKQLKDSYCNRVVDLYNNNVANKSFTVKNLKFAESFALISLLQVIGRSFCFFFSLNNGNNFKSAYNCSLVGIELNSHHSSQFPRLVYEELNRLSQSKSFAHLENNIDYFDFIEKEFKPFLSTKEYLFFLYYSLVQHVRNGMTLSQTEFLHTTGLYNDNYILSQSCYLQNTYHLIDQYKKNLYFSDWNNELLHLFHKNIYSKESFDIINKDFWLLEIKNFNPHAEFLKKILLKESFLTKFPKKNHSQKNIKI